jgi:hypothetical protein
MRCRLPSGLNITVGSKEKGQFKCECGFHMFHYVDEDHKTFQCNRCSREYRFKEEAEDNENIC